MADGNAPGGTLEFSPFSACQKDIENSPSREGHVELAASMRLLRSPQATSGELACVTPLQANLQDLRTCEIKRVHEDP